MFLIPSPAEMQSLPSIDELAAQALASTAAHLRSAPEFTFDLLLVIREFDKNGKLRKDTRTTGESYMSSSRNLDIPLVVNGRPRKEKDVAKSRGAAVEAMEADARARAAHMTKTPFEDTSTHFGSRVNDIRMEPYTILTLCPLSNLRVETFADRPAYALDFAPCPADLVPKVPHRHLAAVRGTLWIDRDTLVIVALRSWLASGPDASPWFESTMQFFAGESPTWLPHRAYFNLAASPTLFGRRDEIDWTISNPRRFTVETSTTIAGTDRNR
jgi:hypothetical protein